MFYFNSQFGQGDGRSARNHRDQYKHITGVRRVFNNAQKQMAQLHGNNAALIPQDVYREFENQTKALMRENNQTLLTDLMPLAKSLPVGKIEHVYRRASDSGIVDTSLGGKPPSQLDKADFDYAKSIKVIHQTGYGRGWMELEGQRSEAFDGLVDDNANAVRAVLDAMAGHIYDGVDVTFDGTDAYGIKNSSQVRDIDIGASGITTINFATSTDSSAIRESFIKVHADMRTKPNNLNAPITYYVSEEIATNFQNFFSTSDAAFGTLKEVLMRIDGVADIKADTNLSDNEMVAVALEDQYIRPLVGMAVNTVPVQRTNPFEDYNFVTWSNIGLEIKTDYTGRTGVGYIREIT